MKNIVIFLIIGIFIFSFGCATLKPERNVVDNFFYSSFPKIKIKIDEDFKYLGDVSKEGDVEGIEITLHGNVTDYPFIIAQKNYVKKALIIQISKTSGHYRLRHPKNIEEKAIEYGSAKIGDNKYLYDIKGASPTLRGYLVKHIYEKGYIMSCGILSRYYRIAGANNYLETIMYYEKIPDDSALNCGTWLNKIYITENHLSYIEEYKKRFESSFEIAGPKTSFEAAGLKTTSENVSPALAAYATTNKTFIEIKEPDQVQEFGKPKYEVNPGDILEVIHTKTCRSGSGICWKVRNIKTGELGYVFAERMRKRHRVYKGESNNVNQEEPWTGKWKVEGHISARGVWILKQRSNKIISTEDSPFNIEGRANGHQFEGKFTATGQTNLYWSVKVKMSSDGMSFKGTTSSDNVVGARGWITGRRVE